MIQTQFYNHDKTSSVMSVRTLLVIW